MADHTPTLRLYNTLGRQLQEFVPRRPGAVRLYACGPTVYQDATIGNFRTYIFVDVLRRTLGALGYDVRHVLNVTDVGHLASDADLGDDKMLLSSRREGKTVWEIAELYTERFFADTRALNLLRPHVIARATDHIDQMIEQIRRLEAGGYTYVANGNVFFDVSRFPRYGELALLDRQQLQAGARISVDQSKRNPEDFGLWFTRSKFEGQAMLWDSPWGRGYPGWHIECSAMSMLYLDQQFDIHCGGIDLIPVHHTNEIAQAEAALGIDPQSAQRWVNYWCHGEFLMVNGAKMSKSKGNWFTLGQLVEGGYAALDFRYFVLGAHYRAHQNFTMQALDAARASRLGLIERVAALLRRAGVEDAAALSPAADGARGGGHEGASHADASHADASHAGAGHADAGHADASHADASHADASHAGAGHADASHADASHAAASHAGAGHADASHADASHAGASHEGGSHPLAVTALNHAANDLAMPRLLALAWRLAKDSDGDPLTGLQVIAEIDTILGLDLIGAALKVAAGVAGPDPAIDALVQEREQARARRDFHRADAIRARLTERGIELRDTAAGTVWRRVTATVEKAVT